MTNAVDRMNAWRQTTAGDYVRQHADEHLAGRQLRLKAVEHAGTEQFALVSDENPLGMECLAHTLDGFARVKVVAEPQPGFYLTSDGRVLPADAILGPLRCLVTAHDLSQPQTRPAGKGRDDEYTN